MRIIDLSMDIEQHWRWPFYAKMEPGFNYRGMQSGHGPINVMGSDHIITQLGLHYGTHCDSPLHHVKGAMTIDQMPLDRFFGDCAVVDVSYKKEKEPITAEDLDKNSKHVRPGDIVIIRTRWDEKYSWKTKEYWTEAPYMSMDACYWPSKHGVRTIACDFSFTGVVRHRILFRTNINNIEYICNAGQIKKDRVKFYAFPIKVKGAFGAPTRAVAVEE